MPEDDEEEKKPKKGKTIAEAYQELSARLDAVEGENERLRDELTRVGTVHGSGDGEQSAGNSSIEDTTEPSDAAQDSEASGEDGTDSHENESDDGQETAESNPDVSEFPESALDEPPRPTHLWWRNPWGGH